MILKKIFFILAIIEEAKAVPGVSILSLIDMVSIFTKIVLPNGQTFASME